VITYTVPNLVLVRFSGIYDIWVLRKEKRRNRLMDKADVFLMISETHSIKERLSGMSMSLCMTGLLYLLTVRVLSGRYDL